MVVLKTGSIGTKNVPIG